MKKLCAIALFAVLAASAFALDLSAGGGLTLGSFSQTTYYAPIGIFDSTETVLTTVPFGFSAYFDATYGVAAVGLQVNGNTHSVSTMIWGVNTIITPSDDNNRSGFLTMSLLGRYPFKLGPVSLFPLLGIEYDLNLYWKDDVGTDLKASLTADEKAWLNQFWFKAGAGADFFVYKSLYVRPLVLLGFKLLNQGEKDAIDAAITAGATTARKTDFVIEAGVQAGWRF